MARLASACLLGLALLTPAAAEPVDLLFQTAHLQDVPPGTALSYAHSRASLPALQLGPDFEQRIALKTLEGADGGAPEVAVTMDADGAPRRLEQFRGVPGNPILMVFLETTVRAVSRATGGSPFYLRNRIKQGLRDGLTSTPMILQIGHARLPARALTLEPFREDANAARLGDFSGLQMRFVISEQAPGMILSMRASTAETPDAPPVYREEIALVPHS